MAMDPSKLTYIKVDDLEAALHSALARHECALGKLKYQLPRPSDAALSELQAAEDALRELQARRYLR